MAGVPVPQKQVPVTNQQQAGYNYMGTYAPAGPGVAFMSSLNVGGVEPTPTKEPTKEPTKDPTGSTAASGPSNVDITAVQQFFHTYGLDALWQGAYEYMLQGYSDPGQIMLMLSTNSTYQQAYYDRFPAVQLIRDKNKERIAAGLPPLAEPLPGHYVALEASYREALHGLPAGLYGTKSDIATWIANETSPQEISDRVTIAKNFINYQANPFVKEALRTAYGMTDTDMIAYQLDSKRTLPFLQQQWSRKMSEANVGGAANSLGFGLTADLLDQIAGTAYGSSFDSSVGGFTRVMNETNDYARLGQIYGVEAGQQDLVREQFGLGGGAEVTTKKNKLASAERAAFGGSSAIARGSLSARSLGQQ